MKSLSLSFSLFLFYQKPLDPWKSTCSVVLQKAYHTRKTEILTQRKQLLLSQPWRIMVRSDPLLPAAATITVYSLRFQIHPLFNTSSELPSTLPSSPKSSFAVPVKLLGSPEQLFLYSLFLL